MEEERHPNVQMSIQRTWVCRGKTTVAVLQTAEPGPGGGIDNVELTYPGVVNAAQRAFTLPSCGSSHQSDSV